MDQDQYRSLVSHLEDNAAASPGAHRTKTLLISSAAYVVLFGLLLAIALLIYLGIRTAYMERHMYSLIRIGLLGLVMVPVFFVVLRVFFIRLAPPEGRYLSREEAPELFSVLNKMRKKLSGPPFHHVLIDENFNAAIFQRPRWGLFGGHTNYLILGLPYLLGVPPKEMLATVAHEYGHVCGNHGKVSAWIYRQRLTFGALYNQIEHNAMGNWIYRGIAYLLSAFMPYYNAYTFVLSRKDEYEADRTATELLGSKINAQGLIRGALLGCWIEETFWPKLYKQANDREKPAFLPYNTMRNAFKVSYPEWATNERLDTAWREYPNPSDTHPALRDRVEATGETAALPPCVETTAAEALLGATAKKLIDEFDHRWWKQEKASWSARYQYATRSKTRLRELSGLLPDNLNLQDLHEYALLSAEFEPPQKAKSLLERLFQRHEGSFPKAEYHYGCLLLAEDDKRGLEYLTVAANTDRHLQESAAMIGYNYLFKKYGEERAQEWWNNLAHQSEEDET